MGKILKTSFRPTKRKIVLVILLTFFILFYIASAPRLCPAAIVECSEGYIVAEPIFGGCAQCITQTGLVIETTAIPLIIFILIYLVLSMINYLFTRFRTSQAFPFSSE